LLGLQAGSHSWADLEDDLQDDLQVDLQADDIYLGEAEDFKCPS